MKKAVLRLSSPVIAALLVLSSLAAHAQTLKGAPLPPAVQEAPAAAVPQVKQSGINGNSASASGETAKAAGDAAPDYQPAYGPAEFPQDPGPNAPLPAQGSYYANPYDYYNGYNPYNPYGYYSSGGYYNNGYHTGGLNNGSYNSSPVNSGASGFPPFRGYESGR